MIKLFIIPHPPDFYPIYSCFRTEQILKEGFAATYKVEFVTTEEEADYSILYYVPHTNSNDKYNMEFINQYNLSKCCVIDNSDENNVLYLPDAANCFLYFKRSLFKWNNQFDRTYIPQPENVRPWNYCVMDGFLRYSNIPYRLRPIDIGCYLRAGEPNRNVILQLIENLKRQNSSLNVKIGPVSNASRDTFDAEYFLNLQQTKLNITCQPTWVGCSREWESVSQGCLTFVDNPFFTPTDAPEDHREYVDFKVSDQQALLYNIQRYLQDQEGAAKIASRGYEWAIQKQRSVHRCEYILSEIRKKENGLLTKELAKRD